MRNLFSPIRNTSTQQLLLLAWWSSSWRATWGFWRRDLYTTECSKKSHKMCNKYGNDGDLMVVSQPKWGSQWDCLSTRSEYHRGVQRMYLSVDCVQQYTMVRGGFHIVFPRSILYRRFVGAQDLYRAELIVWLAIAKSTRSSSAQRKLWISMDAYGPTLMSHTKPY